MSSKIERQLLSEVVYRRMRDILQVDTLALAEQELADGLSQALGGSEVAREEAASAVREQFERAWTRIEEEWRRFRADPTAVFFEPECPLCSSAERPAN